ncbi:hypothetical protein GJ496_005378 [Pomphorhynchus laevis]|nr:hypothetical protein GJ496_005378 [Pomphorhynchus laevis]
MLLYFGILLLVTNVWCQPITDAPISSFIPNLDEEDITTASQQLYTTSGHTNAIHDADANHSDDDEISSDPIGENFFLNNETIRSLVLKDKEDMDIDKFREFINEHNISLANVNGMDDRDKRWLHRECHGCHGFGRHYHPHHHHHGFGMLGAGYLAYKAFRHGYIRPYIGLEIPYHGGYHSGYHSGYSSGYHGGYHGGAPIMGYASRTCTDRITYCQSYVSRCHEQSIYSMCPRTCSMC